LARGMGFVGLQVARITVVCGLCCKELCGQEGLRAGRACGVSQSTHFLSLTYSRVCFN